MTDAGMTYDEIADHWDRALRSISIRHPNPEARPLFTINRDGDAPPILLIQIENHRDTRAKNDRVWSSFTISNTRLAIWPGERLARMWLAAAWAGYIQHEALELVDYKGENPLDPHMEPHRLTPWNRGLRDGYPPVLDSDTLVSALAVVMDRPHVYRLLEHVESGAFDGR